MPPEDPAPQHEAVSDVATGSESFSTDGGDTATPSAEDGMGADGAVAVSAGGFAAVVAGLAKVAAGLGARCAAALAGLAARGVRAVATAILVAAAAVFAALRARWSAQPPAEQAAPAQFGEPPRAH